MANSPCGKCPKAGCGSYHDQCEDYQNFLAKRKELYKIRFTSAEISNLERNTKLTNKRRKHSR